MDPRPRMFIIGAHGFVGGHLVLQASGRWNVIGGDLLASSENEIAIDVADPASVASAFARVRPQVVVLLAAMADIDRCEREPRLTESINADGAEFVARGSAQCGARLIYSSSAAVFDGTRHGYRESDAPTPVSVYGRTKAEAEQRVAKLMPGAAIVRPALVVGRGLRPGTNALLDKLETKFSAGRTVVAPTYELRNPIDVYTLCEFLLELAARPELQGIFHIGATESISRFDLVTLYAERLGYSRDLVVPQTAPIPGRAPRGLDHFLLCERSRTVWSRPVPSLEETIERSLYVTA
ncbi:MAG: SDR family oxidoreductase [Acidobacteriales bacterium]|nr:SDR family oxidoreductase [Terriglobales bacterium]